MDRALHYIGYRMRSERELSDYLKKKGYEEGEVLDVIGRLKEYGYVDDAAFAKEFITQRVAQRPVGRKKLEYDLMQKGIGKDTVQDALEAYLSEEEQAGCNALAEKLLRQKGKDKKAIQSIQRTLISRGFSYDRIKIAIQHGILEVDPCGEKSYDF